MTFFEVHEYLWDVFVFEERRWVILYILRISTPHISALQKEINCLNRENENQGFRENMDFDLQNTTKVTLLMKT